jgi:hypothetical protein
MNDIVLLFVPPGSAPMARTCGEDHTMFAAIHAAKEVYDFLRTQNDGQLLCIEAGASFFWLVK